MLRQLSALSARPTATMRPAGVYPMQKFYISFRGLYNISVDDLLHITMDVDRDESYDAPVPSASSTELSEYLDFYNEPSNRKKYMFATPIEKELLYHFKKMSEEDRNEMIEIAKIKARKNPEKEK